MSDITEDDLLLEIADVVRTADNADAAAQTILKLFEARGLWPTTLIGLLNSELTACDGYCTEDA